MEITTVSTYTKNDCADDNYVLVLRYIQFTK